MSRVIVHRSEWVHTSQSKNKTQAEDLIDYFCDHNPGNRSASANDSLLANQLPSQRRIGVE
jgi:hypothetical protein